MWILLVGGSMLAAVAIYAIYDYEKGRQLQCDAEEAKRIRKENTVKRLNDVKNPLDLEILRTKLFILGLSGYGIDTRYNYLDTWIEDILEKPKHMR